MKKIAKKNKNTAQNNSIVDWDENDVAQINGNLLLSSDGRTWNSDVNRNTLSTGRFRSYDKKNQMEV